MTLKIGNHSIGKDAPPYIIAELSANHNGSLDRALESIRKASECGASAVKIQTYTADTMTIDCDAPEFQIKGGLWDGYRLYDLYNWAHTPYEWHEALFACAKECGITIFSSPFDETAVDLLESLGTPAYKVASFEIVDLPLIRYMARTKKPMIMSSGMAEIGEIEEAITTARRFGCEQLVLLHCISSYPTPIEQANLLQIKTLRDKFGVEVGLSDHTLGTTAAIAAIAQGAVVIEKHFTLSREDKGPDSEFSLEPDELTVLCKDTHDAWASLGSPVFSRQEAEKGNRIFRRSIYFVRDLPEGAVITGADIRRIRPGNGLAPKYFDELIGRKTSMPVKRGMPVTWEKIEK
jgi:pseudaminic acid synthase